jgi:sec-independent protein translocase protein TatA
MFGLGPPELLIIFLIILVLFGAKKLPELARSLGSSMKEFKNATNNKEKEDQKQTAPPEDQDTEPKNQG